MNADFETTNAMFDKMSQDGFPIDSELKWGFYFVDSSKLKLDKVFKELSSSNYKFEQIEKIENGLLQLHVSKIEKLGPEKLHRRNLAFNQLAEYCKVHSYDGWDVEKI